MKSTIKRSAPFFVLWLAVFALPSGAIAKTASTRTFELTYTVNVKDVPQNASTLNMWIPQPTSDEDQQIIDVKIESPYPVSINRDQKYGNTALFLTVQNPPAEGFTIKATYKVTRSEILTANMDHPRNFTFENDQNNEQFSKQSATGKGAEEFSKWLEPGKYAVMNEAVKRFAEEATAGREGTLDKARGIYEFILSKMEYNKQIPGWGEGNVERVCLAIDGGESGTGNCTDFHSLFASMMRSQGIPVKFEMGYPLTPGKNQTEAKKGGYHCWAKFYVAGMGWIPVDISEARKDMSQKEYFWGAVCENRIKFSEGRDIKLPQQQSGEALNYFGPDPYIEVDGEPFNGFERLISYSDLSNV